MRGSAVLILILILLGLGFSACEKDELRSVSFIKDFRIDTLAIDSIPASYTIDTIFRAYLNNSYYYTYAGAGQRRLHLIKPNQRWSREVRSLGGEKFVDGQIQFENVLGGLVVLNAASGEMAESLSPVAGEDFEHAFYYRGQVFNAFRENDRCVIGARPATNATGYTELIAIYDTTDIVRPAGLRFYERGNNAFAVWNCANTVAGGDSYWVVKELTNDARLWTFRAEKPIANNQSFIRNQVFYYPESQGNLTAYHLAGDSLWWKKTGILGAPVGINGAFIYTRSGNNLQVVDRRSGSIAHNISGIDDNYFYEEAFVFKVLPDEFEILDRENLRLLKSYTNELEFLSGMGNSRYMIRNSTPAGDTTLLHLLRIVPL